MHINVILDSTGEAARDKIILIGALNKHLLRQYGQPASHFDIKSCMPQDSLKHSLVFLSNNYRSPCVSTPLRRLLMVKRNTLGGISETSFLYAVAFRASKRTESAAGLVIRSSLAIDNSAA